MKKFKITVGITTYNRKNILKIFSILLSEQIGKNINVRIYDDHSSEYNEEFLREIFPYAKEILRRDKNFKADKNMYYMYKEFLKTEDDYLLQLDSDMLIGTNFFKNILMLCDEILREEGVYSLYNSNNHENIIKNINKNVGDEIFYSKEHIGGACVLFSREVIKKIIDNIEIKNQNYSNFDWRWSNYLVENKIPIYVSKNSYVQHIGMGGQNNLYIKNLDIGENFIGLESIEGANFLIKYYEYLIKEHKNFIKNLTISEYLKLRCKNNKYLYKIYKIFIKVLGVKIKK